MTHDDDKVTSAKAPFDLIAALDAADAALGDGGEGSIRLMVGTREEPDYALAHKRQADGSRVHTRFALKGGAPK